MRVRQLAPQLGIHFSFSYPFSERSRGAVEEAEKGKGKGRRRGRGYTIETRLEGGRRATRAKIKGEGVEIAKDM